MAQSSCIRQAHTIISLKQFAKVGLKKWTMRSGRAGAMCKITGKWRARSTISVPPQVMFSYSNHLVLLSKARNCRANAIQILSILFKQMTPPAAIQRTVLGGDINNRGREGKSDQ